jgi:hypothetical protein
VLVDQLALRTSRSCRQTAGIGFAYSSDELRSSPKESVVSVSGNASGTSSRRRREIKRI